MGFKMDVENLTLNWEEFHKNLKVAILKDEKEVLKTFEEEIAKLREARLKGLISKQEFLEGLAEILKGFSIFETVSRNLSPLELKLHLAVLKTMILAMDKILKMNLTLLLLLI